MSRPDNTGPLAAVARKQRVGSKVINDVNEKGELLVGDGLKASYLNLGDAPEGSVLAVDRTEPTGLKWSALDPLATNTTDYIVLGAGNAGNVVASKLASKGFSVRVIEQGPDLSLKTTDPNVLNRDFGYIYDPNSAPNIQNRYNRTGTGLNTVFIPSSNVLSFVTKGNRDHEYYAYSRGQGLGSGIMNYLQDGVGSLTFYDNMAADINDSSWNGPNMLKHAIALEDRSDIVNAAEYEGDKTLSGTTGWLKIKATAPDTCTNAVLHYFENGGLDESGGLNIPVPTNRDLRLSNGIGAGYTDMQIKTMKTSTVVPGHYILTHPDLGINDELNSNSVWVPETTTHTYTNQRATSYNDLLQKSIDNNNVKVEFNHCVTRLLLRKLSTPEGNNTHECYGVEAIHNQGVHEASHMSDTIEILGPTSFKASVGPGVKENQKVQYFARKEVIVSCGAIQSPQLLMCSGIGPKHDDNFVGSRVTEIVPCPGVGNGSMDHMEFTLSYEANNQVYIHPWQAFYLFAHRTGSEDTDVFPANAAGLTGKVPVFDGTVAGLAEQAKYEDWPNNLKATYAYNYDFAVANNTPSGENGGCIALDWHSGKPLNYGLDTNNINDIHAALWSGVSLGFDRDWTTPFIDENDTVSELHGRNTSEFPDEGRHYRRNIVPTLNPDNVDSTDKSLYTRPALGPKGSMEVINNSQWDQTDPKVNLLWLVENLIPTVTGTIRLLSNDNTREPRIDQNMYNDDDGLERMARFILKLRYIMTQINDNPTFNDVPNTMVGAFPSTSEYYPGNQYTEISEIKLLIRNFAAFGHHISGGCAMGTDDDVNAVLDTKLRVRRVKSLRVIDVSVYKAPWLHGYNTARAAFMVGSKGGDMVLEDAYN